MSWYNCNCYPISFGGAITGSVITNPGLGYTVAPTVLVDPPTVTPREEQVILFYNWIYSKNYSIAVGTGGTDITFTTKRDDGFTNYDGLVNGIIFSLITQQLVMVYHQIQLVF